MFSRLVHAGTLELRIERIEDWLAELPDGKIRGGYTTQAFLLIEMKKPASNRDSLEAELGKFEDEVER